MGRGRKEGRTDRVAGCPGSYIRLRAISPASRSFGDCKKAKCRDGAIRVEGVIR